MSDQLSEKLKRNAKEKRETNAGLRDRLTDFFSGDSSAAARFVEKGGPVVYTPDEMAKRQKLLEQMEGNPSGASFLGARIGKNIYTTPEEFIDDAVKLESGEPIVEEDRRERAAPTFTPLPMKSASDENPSPTSIKPTRPAFNNTEVASFDREAPEYTPPKLDDLRDELSAARERYDQDGDRLALREAIEKIAQGVGRFAAGWYGNKTNTDLSGVKFSETDWDKKQDRLDRQKQQVEEDIRQRRLERRQDADRQYQREQTNYIADRAEHGEKVKLAQQKDQHQDKMEYYYEELRQKGMMDLAKLSQKLKGDPNKYREEALKASEDVLAINKDEKMGDDEKKAAIKVILQSRLNVSPDVAERMATKPGWFWGTTLDGEGVQNAISVILSAKDSGIEEGKTVVFDGDVLGTVDATPEQAAAAGYLVLK